MEYRLGKEAWVKPQLYADLGQVTPLLDFRFFICRIKNCVMTGLTKVLGALHSAM